MGQPVFKRYRASASRSMNPFVKQILFQIGKKIREYLFPFHQQYMDVASLWCTIAWHSWDNDPSISVQHLRSVQKAPAVLIIQIFHPLTINFFSLEIFSILSNSTRSVAESLNGFLNNKTGRSRRRIFSACCFRNFDQNEKWSKKYII